MVSAASVKARQTDAASLLLVERPRFALMNMMTNLHLEAVPQKRVKSLLRSLFVSFGEMGHV